MRYLYLSALILTLGGLSSCDTSGPKPGENGGPCRVNLTPCDEGLVCSGDGCHRPTQTDELVLDALIELRLQGVSLADQPHPFAVEADGESSAGVQITVVHRDSLEPWSGTIRLWLDESSGALQSNTLELDEAGKATTLFTACDQAWPSCPSQTQIKVTTEDDLFTVIGVSEVIMLVEPSPDPEAGGAGGAGE